jgi:hypothetical protein
MFVNLDMAYLYIHTYLPYLSRRTSKLSRESSVESRDWPFASWINCYYYRDRRTTANVVLKDLYYGGTIAEVSLQQFIEKSQDSL